MLLFLVTLWTRSAGRGRSRCGVAFPVSEQWRESESIAASEPLARKDRHMKHFGDYLHLSSYPALAVVVTTAVMYLLLVWLLHTWGARLLANPSSHTTATTVVLGAIVGRASLGLAPDLEAGALALATVLVIMVALGRLRRHPRDRAEVIVLDGVMQDHTLRRLGLTEGDVWSRLRQAGRGSLEGLALVLLEPSGMVTLLADDVVLRREALADVRGAESLPAHLFERSL